MRGQTLKLATTVEIFTEECCACGVIFGLTNYFQQERRGDHKNFYCPNGHSQSYRHESEAEKNARLLREEQARHQRTLANWNEAEKRAAEAAADLQRHKKRVKHGVCPCCKRTFKQLAAHMKTKHPDYAK